MNFHESLKESRFLRGSVTKLPLDAPNSAPRRGAAQPRRLAKKSRRIAAASASPIPS